MNATKLLMLSTALLVAGCSKNDNPPHETTECMNYRAMMTAPMPPDAMNALKEKCEQSMKQSHLDAF